MKSILSAICLVGIFCTTACLAQPTTWVSRGPGGGGALFLPSFNPSTPGEISIACDMGQEFVTRNFGTAWQQVHFKQLQTNNNHGRVCYTSDTNIRYSIDATNIEGNDSYRPTRSTDAGKTWNVLATDPTGSATSYLIASTTDPNTVIVCDYENVFLSNNAGATWKNIYSTSSPSGIHVGGFLFAGSDAFIGLSNGILYSSDGANSFSFKGGMLGIDTTTEAIFSFAGAKQNGEYRFFAAVHASGDVYGGVTALDKPAFIGIYSLDWTAQTWSMKNLGGSGTAIPYFVGMAENNTSVCYAAGGSEQNVPTILKTTDAGGTWIETFMSAGNQNIATGWSGSGGDRQWTYGEFALGFAVNPSDADQAIFTDYGFAHLTTNGGTAWQQAYVAPQTQNTAGSNTPRGKSYASIGLENTTAWHVVWLDSLNMYACFSDIQGCRSTDGGDTWSFNYTGHSDNSLYNVVKHPATNVVYGATSTVHDMYQSTYLQDARIDNGKGKVLYSKDEGATWNVLHDFAHPVVWLALDPSNSERLYASVIHSTQGGVYVTNSLGGGPSTSWTKLPAPPRTSGHPFCLKVLNDGKLLATFSGRRDAAGKFTASSGLFLWDGTSWADVSDPGMQYWTKDVVLDPSDPMQNTWYVCVFSGWGGAPNGKGGLYRTTNRGASWTKINSLDRVTSVSFNPQKYLECYLTTETEGLWLCKNIRETTPVFSLVQQYSFRQPERVFFSPYKQGEVWVTSFGNGMKRSEPTTAVGRPGKVTLVSPIDTDSTVTSPFTLKWNSVPGASLYNVTLIANGISDVFNTRVVDLDTATFYTLPLCSKYSWFVSAKNGFGTGEVSDTWTFVIKCPTTVDEELREKHLAPYPNPTTDFSFLEIPAGELENADDKVVVDIYDSAGRKVLAVATEVQGAQRIQLDLRGLPSGAYVGIVKGVRSELRRTFRIVKR